MLLFDLNSSASVTPRVVAAASRVSDERSTQHEFSFTAVGQADTNGVVRIQMRLKPAGISVAGKPLPRSDYTIDGDTLLIRFANSADPVRIVIAF